MPTLRIGLVAASALSPGPVDAQITPAASNSVVYAGNPPGGLLALRAADGQLLWKSGSRFTTGPIVAAGSVYVSDGTSVSAIRA